MKNIQPTYLTFKQTKLLKEIGFEDIQIDYGLNQMLNNCKAPEQWQVVEWLRINHSIWVEVLTEKSLFIFQIKKIGKGGFIAGKFENTPQEAYSAAFDYVLNNNLI